METLIYALLVGTPSLIFATGLVVLYVRRSLKPKRSSLDSVYDPAYVSALRDLDREFPSTNALLTLCAKDFVKTIFRLRELLSVCRVCSKSCITIEECLDNLRIRDLPVSERLVNSWIKGELLVADSTIRLSGEFLVNPVTLSS